MPKSNLEMTTAQLARCSELPDNGGLRRFRVETADGRLQTVSQTRRGDIDWLLCHRHGSDDCECAYRVKLVLVDEYVEAGKLALLEGKTTRLTALGFVLRGDGLREGEIQGKARFGVVR